MVLVSFDIDGTLEIGQPPGPVPLRLVALTKLRGCVVGSASDRTLDEQRQTCASSAIAVDFVSHKHLLRDKTLGFGCMRLVHIGDSLADEYYARLAGFEFLPAARANAPAAAPRSAARPTTPGQPPGGP